MIKNNKLKTLISSLIIFLPTLYGLTIWDKLPDEMVSHMGLSGEADALSPKALCVFGLPLVLLVLHLLSLWLSGKDPSNKNQNQKAMGVVFWVLPASSLFVSTLFYSAALQKEFNPMALVLGLLAFMFIFIGNYLPKCKQNATMGIKIKWTLENAENWNATHRFAGRIWFICGFLLLPCILLSEKAMPVILAAVITATVVVPTAYSYLYYRKQLRNGNYTSDSVAKKMPKSYKIVTIVILAAILILLPLLLNTGDINFTAGEDALSIEADFYSDITVNYEDIDNIEFREVTANGIRTGGFGSMRLLMGQFKNDEFGYYTRYTYYDDAGCIVITVGENILVIAGKTLTETKTLYDTLTEKIK